MYFSDDLRLRIAKSAVVLEDLDPRIGEHKASVQNALVRVALLGHLGDRRLHERLGLGPQSRSQCGCRGVRAHPARVETLVAGPGVFQGSNFGNYSELRKSISKFE